MKLSSICNVMTGELAKSFVKYSKFSPTPLSLKKLKNFGDDASLKRSFEFLRLEMPVRLANIMQEIHLLPDKLLNTPSGKLVLEIYEKNFQEMIAFETKDSDNVEIQNDFTKCLAEMVRRNNTNVDILSEGVMEMKEMFGIDSSLDNQLSYFLDRYYMSRISIRMLINQHVILFGPHLRHEKDIVGSIHVNCDVVQIIKDAFNNAKYLCEHYYIAAPEMTLILSPNGTVPQIVYVPSHLYHILFELFKNSMRALVEKRDETSKLPPIDILVVSGKEDLTIRISDKGGGICRSMMPLIFNYTFTTAKYQPSLKDGGQATMAGFGYGLPLSRLYAKYLNGDLAIVSMDGYGTDAYVFLKIHASDADELLPVFSRSSVLRHAKQFNNRTDWSR